MIVTVFNHPDVDDAQVVPVPVAELSRWSVSSSPPRSPTMAKTVKASAQPSPGSTSLLTIGYMISRGLAKSGSRERYNA